MIHANFLSVAQIVPRSQAEGPGWRFALWVQGCPMRCPGCCNPEFLAFDKSQQTTLGEVLTQLDNAWEKGIEGISLLGGEPFAHAKDLAPLAEYARNKNLSVMVYSGYTLEEIQQQPEADALLANTDLLVDGRYDRTQPEKARRWIGSANQRVHFLTNRYSPKDECWKKPNTLEIRLTTTELTINGFPADHAKGLWKGWTRKPQKPGGTA